jgi:nicotinate-nucleotide adenylyltransferase
MGGTFDPVHIGHLRTAEEAIEMLNLDHLLFIPAAYPPHKPGRQILSFAHRFRMLELATLDHPRFRLSDIEQKLPGKSFTAITLRTLHENARRGVELYFLVGLDAFLEIDTWWHYKDLFRLANMVVLRRPGYSEEQVSEFLSRRVSSSFRVSGDATCFIHPELLPVYYLNNTRLGISSTQIRLLVAQGRSIRYLVPADVMGYIEEEKLYRLTPAEQDEKRT